MTDTPSPVPAPLPELQPIFSATVPKPGYLTSEFWLKVAAFVLTTLLASGAIPTSGVLAQVVAMIATMLGSFVYTASRTSIKNAAANPEGAQ